MASMNISRRWRLGMNCEVSRVGEGAVWGRDDDIMAHRAPPWNGLLADCLTPRFPKRG